MTMLPASSPCIRILIALCLALLASCQQENNVSSGESIEVSGEIVLSDSTRPPEQLRWSARNGGLRDSLVFHCAQKTCEFKGRLPKDATDSPVLLEFWEFGVRYLTIDLVKTQDRYTLPSTDKISGSRDQVATLLLERLDSLHAIDSGYAPLSHEGVRRALADALATGTAPLAAAYPSSLPLGLDSSGIAELALRAALRRQGSLAQIASNWGLALTYQDALPLVLRLLKADSALKDDSLRLFPPSSLRLVAPISFSDLPVPGGRTVTLSGRFECDSGLAKVRTTILKNSDTTTRLFQLFLNYEPAVKKWDLSEGLSVAAKNGTPFGTYTLLVQIEDRSGVTLKSSVVFQVIAPPDDKGPSISLISPRQESILSSDDSLVEIRVIATDASGVDSVRIDGRAPTLSGDTSRLVVKIPASGTTTPILVRAWDGLGNSTDSILRISRPTPTGQLTPSMTILSPTRRDTIILPVDSPSVRIVVSASSPYGVADSGVLIDKMVAERISSTTWSRIVPVAATGIKTTIAIEMRDNHGTRVPEFIDVLRRKDSLGPALRRIVPVGALNQLEFQQSLAEIRFEARDPSGLDSLWIETREGSNAVRTIPQRLEGGMFFAIVSIPATNDTVQVHVIARDSNGNRTDSVLKYLRRSTPRETMFPVVLLSPSTRSGNLLPKQIDTFRVVWRLNSPNGIAWNRISMGSKPTDTLFDSTRGMGFCTGNLKRVNDSTASCLASIPEGGPYAMILYALDKSKRSVLDTVFVSRVQSPPSISLKWIPPPGLDTLDGTKALSGRFDSVELAWSLSGECPTCSVSIDRKTVTAPRRKVALPLGNSRHEIQVWYQNAVIASDTFTLHRVPKTILKRLTPTSDTLDSSATSVELSWKAEHTLRVAVDGKPVDATKGGIISVKLEPLHFGANRTTVIAFDSLGAPDTTISV
ncbi:MAG: hypothetical protein RL173_2222, partial [Fibrobacterota bacterium]